MGLHPGGDTFTFARSPVPRGDTFTLARSPVPSGGNLDRFTVLGYAAVSGRFSSEKMELEFAVIIERDPESGWLVGSVAELPGYYTQAPTLASLEENMRDAIQVCLDTLSEQESQGSFPTFLGLQRLQVAV